jgi:hypothetical protein
MRTLAGTTSTGVAAAVTTPGYFISIAFPTPLQMSTRGTFTWDSKTWTAYDVQVSGLAADGSESALNGSLSIGNADLSIGASVLLHGVAGRAVKVWSYYGDTAPGAGDPVLVFDGVADTADIPENGPVRITLQQSGGATLFCPRTYITADAGFHWLPTPGQTFTWNGEKVRLREEGI